LGPTLEYYSLVCKEILNPELQIWRKTEDGSLFPTPHSLDLKIGKYTVE